MKSQVCQEYSHFQVEPSQPQTPRTEAKWPLSAKEHGDEVEAGEVGGYQVAGAQWMTQGSGQCVMLQLDPCARRGSNRHDVRCPQDYPGAQK